jgi:hypothetical protein
MEGERQFVVSWFWVFPSHTLSTDPRVGIVRRHHISDSVIRAHGQDPQASLCAYAKTNSTIGATYHPPAMRHPIHSVKAIGLCEPMAGSASRPGDVHVAVGDRNGPAIGGAASLVAVEGELFEAVDVVRGHSGHIVPVNGGRRATSGSQKVCKRFVAGRKGLQVGPERQNSRDERVSEADERPGDGLQ